MHIFEPKKEIVYKQLKERILSGDLFEGQKLPKELDFSKELGVAKVTLRSALSRLEKDGLVARIPSKGTFVLPLKKTTRTLLVLTSQMDHKESPNLYILPEINRSAYEQGVEIESLDLDYIEGLTGEEISKVCEEKYICAIILLSSGFLGHESIIAKLKATKLPVVLPHANEEDSEVTGFASIVIPERPSWRDAVLHLRQLNHNRIATLALVSSQSHFRGYDQADYLELLNEIGADDDVTLIKPVSYNRNEVILTTKELMALDPPPTAILCYSDFLAIYVYEAIKELGLHIPTDVSVMGFCGYPGGAFLQPPLTTIDLEYWKMAEMSVELALKLSVETPASPEILNHTHKLLERRSVSNIQKTLKGGAVCPSQARIHLLKSENSRIAVPG
jgi:DNA-binding LacI/PurR family transcriptional regulator